MEWRVFQQIQLSWWKNEVLMNYYWWRSINEAFLNYITNKSTNFAIKVWMFCELDTGYQQICLQYSNGWQRKISCRVQGKINSLVIYYISDLNRQFRYQTWLTRITRIWFINFVNHWSIRKPTKIFSPIPAINQLFLILEKCKEKFSPIVDLLPRNVVLFVVLRITKVGNQ